MKLVQASLAMGITLFITHCNFVENRLKPTAGEGVQPDRLLPGPLGGNDLPVCLLLQFHDF